MLMRSVVAATAFPFRLAIHHALPTPPSRPMAAPMLPDQSREGSEGSDPESRCLACGQQITSRQQILRVGDLVVHLRCAVYRRQLLRR